MSLGELRKIAEEGGLTAEVVTRALLNQGDKLTKEFENIAPSITKAPLVFLDSVTNYIGQLDKGLGLSKAIARQVLSVADTINKASVDLDLRIASKMQELGVVQKLKDVVLVGGGVLNVLDAIAGRIANTLPSVLAPVLTLFERFALYLAINEGTGVLKTLTKGEIGRASCRERVSSPV